MPRKKKKVVTLAVGDAKLASAISEEIAGVKCQISGVVPELMRGIRMHFEQLVKELPHHSLSKAQLSLGHGYSRKKACIYLYCIIHLRFKKKKVFIWPFGIVDFMFYALKVKFDIHRVDNMVIQSIALLDQLDKDINLFGMRIREWLVKEKTLKSSLTKFCNANY